MHEDEDSVFRQDAINTIIPRSTWEFYEQLYLGMRPSWEPVEAWDETDFPREGWYRLPDRAPIPCNRRRYLQWIDEATVTPEAFEEGWREEMEDRDWHLRPGGIKHHTPPTSPMGKTVLGRCECDRDKCRIKRDVNFKMAYARSFRGKQGRGKRAALKREKREAKKGNGRR